MFPHTQRQQNVAYGLSCDKIILEKKKKIQYVSDMCISQKDLSERRKNYISCRLFLKNPTLKMFGGPWTANVIEVDISPMGSDASGLSCLSATVISLIQPHSAPVRNFCIQNRALMWLLCAYSRQPLRNKKKSLNFYKDLNRQDLRYIKKIKSTVRVCITNQDISHEV